MHWGTRAASCAFKNKYLKKYVYPKARRTKTTER